MKCMSLILPPPFLKPPPSPSDEPANRNKRERERERLKYYNSNLKSEGD